MNIENRKNNKLIFRLIELSDLVSGRDNIELDCNMLIDDIKAVDNRIKDYVNDFNNTINNIRKIKNIENYLYIGHTEYGYEEGFRKWDFTQSLNLDCINEKLAQDFEFILNRVDSTYGDIMRFLPTNYSYVGRDLSNNLFTLGKIVYRKENINLINQYEELHKKVLEELENYNFKIDLPVRLEDSTLSIIGNMINNIEKRNGLLFTDKLEKENKKIIADIRKRVDVITKEIENEFINLIPKKYIFNENFRNYAIECFFYERCDKMGEVINLYENYELHSEANITLKQTLDSLNNFQAMQFHMLMQINDSIQSVGSEVSSLKDNFDDISNKIEDVSYSNERIHSSILESNYALNSQIESANLLAKKQLDSLSEISKSSIKIGKNIYEVKEFTDSYRRVKALKGEFY